MRMPVTLQKKITEFLISLPNIHDHDGQRALIYQSGVDQELQDQISFGKSPTQFVPFLVSTLIKYGQLHDRRYAIEAVLETTKNYIGQDRKAYCDTLLQEIRTLIKEQTQQSLAKEDILSLSQISSKDRVSNSNQSEDTESLPVLLSVRSNPYVGLSAFQEEDAARFFGREQLIKQLSERFWNIHPPQQNDESPLRILPILGPSGSGKSSLVRAGLIPELKQHPLPAYDAIRFIVITPGGRPLETLSRILAKVSNPHDPNPVAKTREFTEEMKIADYDGLRRIAEGLPESQNTLLIILIDQFEEIYTQCEDREERTIFIENLLNAVAERAAHISIVLTLRSDFLNETQHHPQLNQAIAKYGIIVPILSKEEIYSAITKPAEQAGYPLDAATITLLIEQTKGRVGSLPLLQFALTRIWEGMEKGIDPAETLSNMNGVGGALAQEAQKLYDMLPETNKLIAYRSFLKLIKPGEGSFNNLCRVKITDMVPYNEPVDQVYNILYRFAAPETRLLTLYSEENGEITAEITHEALIENWSTLQDWIANNRDDLRFERRLTQAVKHWESQQKPAGLLWRPPDLDLLRNFYQRLKQNMTSSQIYFFKESERRHWKEMWSRRLNTTVRTVLILILGLGGYWLSLERKTARQFEERFKILETRIKELQSDDPAVLKLKEQAGIALKEGDLKKVEQIVVGADVLVKSEAVILNHYGISEETFNSLAEELVVTKSALNSFFRILEQQQVPLEDLDSNLQKIASQYNELMQRLEIIQSEDPQVYSLKTQARQAIENSEFEKAEELLSQAEQRDLEAIRLLQETILQGRTEALEKRKISAAETNADNGQLQELQVQYAKAAEYFQKAAELMPEDYKQERAIYLNKAGYNFFRVARYADALTLFEQSLAIFQEIDDKAGEGITLNNISRIYDARSDYTTALKYVEQSLEITQEIGDRAGEATTFDNLGQIYYAQGDYTTALTYWQQSLMIRLEIGDKSGEGTTLNNIGQIYLVQGEYATALEYWEQSLMIAQEIGDRTGEGATLNNIGQIYDAQGDYTTALGYLEQSLAIRQEIGDKAGEGRTLNNLSQIYNARGDYATALQYVEQSLAIRQEIGDKAGEGTTLNNLSQIYNARGDYATALEYLEQSLAIRQKIGDKAGEGTTPQ